MVEVREEKEERLEEALVSASRVRWYESSRWAMRSSFCLRRPSQVVVGVGVVGLGKGVGEGEVRMLELELDGSVVAVAVAVVVIVPPPSSSVTTNLVPRGVLVWLLRASGEGEGESAARGGGAIA